MKALRYILSLMAILSVLGVSATTYGTLHQPRNRRVVYHQVEMRADMPVATMNSVNSTVMKSGSTLPMAAATGVTVAGENPSHKKGPRRIGENEGFDDEDEPAVPVNPYPIGDGILPMMLLICAYCGFVALRRKRMGDVHFGGGGR